MAANTDKIRKKKSNFSTTLNGGISDSDQTIALSSGSGLPTDTAITLTIDRVDVNGTSTPTKKERVTGVVSGNNLTNSLRGEDSTTAQSHTSGAVVEDIWDADTWNDAASAFLVEHGQDGTHTGFAKLAGAQTFTGAKTFGSQLLIVTRPKIVTSVDDTNGNEVIDVTATGSAVNELGIANAATNNNPVLSAVGDDSNIGIDVKPKGTGAVRMKCTASIQVTGSGVNTATGDSQFFFRIPPELNGMNLVAVSACVATAGTTNTTDIQIHRVRSGTPADMLSTKITIDSGEVDTATAAAAAVIDTSNDDVATADQIHVDVDAVSTTPAKGLVVNLQFALP